MRGSGPPRIERRTVKLILVTILIFNLPFIGRGQQQAPDVPPFSPQYKNEMTSREIISLLNERDRQYSQRFDAQQQAVKEAFFSAKEAVDKAERASEKRFDSVNEFRGQLKDQQNTFLPRTEYIANHKALEISVKENAEKLALVTQRQYEENGRSSGSNWMWGVVAGVIGILMAFATFVVSAAALLMSYLQRSRSTTLTTIKQPV